ncbi:hypothetical protein [Modicisalibacter coralii]|uniref:hypothetical protein n=1 Tax=Modicisalibacter coralii TaxID=2304602 RepID=UPI00139687CA|nr:hypothetical protein [Halomonas coralii]
MNPTHAMAVWLHQLTQGWPPEIQGAAIFIGIMVPLLAAFALCGICVWGYERLSKR